jgi:hypothetical protein
VEVMEVGQRGAPDGGTAAARPTVRPQRCGLQAA